MRRRRFTLLFGTAAAWPLTLHAQQKAMPVAGFLSFNSPGPVAQFVAAFREGLAKMSLSSLAHSTACQIRALIHGPKDRYPQALPAL